MAGRSAQAPRAWGQNLDDSILPAPNAAAWAEFSRARIAARNARDRRSFAPWRVPTRRLQTTWRWNNLNCRQTQSQASSGSRRRLSRCPLPVLTRVHRPTRRIRVVTLVRERGGLRSRPCASNANGRARGGGFPGRFGQLNDAQSALRRRFVLGFAPNHVDEVSVGV